MANTPRDTYRYHLKVGNEILHRGVTNDLQRRESEHQEEHPGSRIVQIGPVVTRETGLEWERNGGKKI